MRDTFNSRMDAGRANADRARARGFHTGKQAAGWARSRSDYAPASDWERREQMSRIRWRDAVAEFLEAMRFEVYGDQWEGL